MDKELYRLIDGYNNDVVIASDDIEAVREAAGEYSDDCEGDWLPCLYKLDETDRYVLIEDFRF